MFTPELAKDLFLIPDHAGGTIALVDIDEARLATMTKVVELLAAELGVADRWTVAASADRCEVLPGTDYVVNCIEVSGVDCVGHDNDIPARYGVDQCIGDTVGPGGVFKGLRTIPVWLEVLADVERLAPQAIVLNYTNPMSMMCLAAARTSAACRSWGCATRCRRRAGSSRRARASRGASSPGSARASTTSRGSRASSTTASTSTRR